MNDLNSEAIEGIVDEATAESEAESVASQLEKLEVLEKTGIDFEARTLYLCEDITPESVRKAIYGLRTLFVYVVNENRRKMWRDDVTIILTTGGGDEYSGWALIDAIQHYTCLPTGPSGQADVLKPRIKILARGHVGSMGAAILQAGDLRLIEPNCRFMVHMGSGSFGDHTIHSSTLVAMGKEQVDNNARYVNCLAHKALLSREEIVALCDKESYLSAAEVIRCGFADVMNAGLDFNIPKKE